MAMDGRGGLRPVGRETVQDRIYRQLRDALIRGAFDAGEGFVVADMAERMDTSSMPVREALARLVSERALEACANRRVRVPLLTRARADDLAQARVLIEGSLVRKAMPHLGPDDFATLLDLTDDYERADGPATCAHLNHAFHFHLYDRAGSDVLLPMVESLWMQVGPYLRASARLFSPVGEAAATFHHRNLVAALRSGHVDRAVFELTADIQQTFRILARAPVADWPARSAA